MYNGIGLTTPRGSGTNGHVQRNWAFVRPGKKDNSNYRSEEDIKKLDATLNRPPNKEILDHDRKRKIEVKCIEFEEILEKQGRTPEEIKSKVDSYRQKLMGQGKTDLPKDEFGRIAVRETHHVAEAQQEKNAKLREAFNISEYFVEGSSFDTDRKAKEDLAKSLALQKELDAQRESAAADAAAAASKESSRRYALVRTPSKERDVAGGDGAAAASGDERERVSKSEKKKKKKRTRESSASPERKKDKKKKSKKHKKESKSKKKKSRKRKASESDGADSDRDSDGEAGANNDSEREVKKPRKRSKKDKKKRDKKKTKDRSNPMEKARSNSPKSRVKDQKSDRRKRHDISDALSKASGKNPFRSRSRERLTANFAASRYDSSTDSRSRDRAQKLENARSGHDTRRSRSREPRHKSVEHIERKRKHSVERSERRQDDSYTRDERKRRRRYSRSRSRENKHVGNGRDSKSRRREHSPTTRSPPRPCQLKNRTRSRSLSVQKKGNRSPNPMLVSQKRRTSPVVEKKNPFNPFKASDVAAIQTPPKTGANPFKAITGTMDKHLTAPAAIVKLRKSENRLSTDSSSSDSESDNSRTNLPVTKSVITDRATLLIPERAASIRPNIERKHSDARETRTEPTTRKIDISVKKNMHASRSPSNCRSQSRREHSRSMHSPSCKHSPASVRSYSRHRSVERKRSTSHKVAEHTPKVETQSINSRQSRSELISIKVSPTRKSNTPPPTKTTTNLAVEVKVEPTVERGQSSRSSHNSSDLSYSPALRNPERYRDILDKVEKDNDIPSSKRKEETKESQKTDREKAHAEERVAKRMKSRDIDSSREERERKRQIKKEARPSRDSREHRDSRDVNNKRSGKAGPVVRLQSQSDDDSGNEDRGEKVVSLDEFQESKRSRELKELKMFEQLKTGIAAKAKEKIKTIEKMAATSTTGGSAAAGSEPLVAALADSTLVDTIVSKVSTATVAAAESAARRSRSRSRRSRSRAHREGTSRSRRSISRSRSSHYSSSSSRSRSRSHRSSRSRSRSHSSHSSSSSRTSSRSSSSSGSSRTGSRSPSIPRRRGSPSFLDRRRITSARKRPIPYHHKTSSDASSFCSSCCSHESSVRSPSLSPTHSSRSPTAAF